MTSPLARHPAARHPAARHPAARHPAARHPAARGLGRTGGGPAMRTQRDRGSSAIELAILAPMLLALIWLTIQYALYYQGRQVALAAAQLGARVASQDAGAVPGWQALAERSAEDYYQGLGTKVLGSRIRSPARPARARYE
jgi:Flp pilus assembly protein TadG